MDHLTQEDRGMRGNQCIHDSEAGLKCPIAAQSIGLHAVTAEQCESWVDTGCPVAPAIQGRLRFETVLTELSAKLINVRANKVDSQIESGLRLIVELLGIDRSGLGELSADGHQFLVTHSYQLPGVPPSARLILHSQFPTYTKMIQEGKVIRLPDDLPPEAIQEREYCHRTGLKSNLTIPLTVMGTVVDGIGFSSFRSNRELPDELIPRLRLVGDFFTNALARKQSDEALCITEQSLRQSQQGLRQLASKLLHAQEEERRRIAREMHDDWSQRLAILGIDAAKLQKHLGTKSEGSRLLSSIQDQLVNLSEDVHALSRQLHPSILNDLGLEEAIRSECDSFSRRSGITVDYHADEIPSGVSKDVALCVYRVAQESLRNLAKHAAVIEAWVTLGTIEAELVLQIRDQGVGFDPNTARSQTGLGLSSMEERVRLIHGRLSVASAPGRGTNVEVRVPLEGRTA